MLLMLISGSTLARADELPEEACAARMPFTAIGDVIGARIQQIIDEEFDLEIPHLTRTANYSGTTFTVSDVSGGTGNDPNSSNDDLIHAVAGVDYSWVYSIPPVIYVSGSGSMLFHMYLMFPQDPPSVVDPESGYTCQYAMTSTVTHTLVHVLDQCPGGTPSPSCSPNVMWWSDPDHYSYYNASWYADPTHPERNLWLEAALSNAELTPEQHPDRGCDETYLEPCARFDEYPEDETTAEDRALAASHPESLCHICRTPDLTFRTVTTEASS
jgi:hypothetical protein